MATAPQVARMYLVMSVLLTVSRNGGNRLRCGLRLHDLRHEMSRSRDEQRLRVVVWSRDQA